MRDSVPLCDSIRKMGKASEETRTHEICKIYFCQHCAHILESGGAIISML